MKISVEMVRKLAKLDPGVREIIYSFIDEFEKEEKDSLTKEDIVELVKKIDDIEAEVKEIDTIKDVYEKVNLSLAESKKQIEGMVSYMSSIDKRLEELLSINKEMLNFLKNKKDVDLSKIVHSIEDHTKGVKDIIEEFKYKVESIKESIGSNAHNRIITKLSKALKKKLSLNVKEHFRSKVFEIDGKKIHFPIFGNGTKNKKIHAIVGKIVKNPTKQDIDDFITEVESLIKEKQIPPLVCKVLVVEEIDYELEKIAEKKGVSILWTQDL
jgi:uncharacterized protein YoxC